MKNSDKIFLQLQLVKEDSDILLEYLFYDSIHHGQIHSPVFNLYINNAQNKYPLDLNALWTCGSDVLLGLLVFACLSIILHSITVQFLLVFETRF